MARIIGCVCVFLLLTLSELVLSQTGPLVTLSHGGQLRGKSFTWNETDVDVFLGVRYANPPVRFSKPEDADSWTGEVDATSVGDACIQGEEAEAIIGSEDCLYLDITVPGGVQIQTLKPVMVWIHGGGFRTGTGSIYLSGPLAVRGDVIVVNINYRLGIFGFLSDGEGTGNLGLWDQRKALQWVQENIAEFGGDADMVTIFGESAGAASVSAQVLSQQTSDLFKRAIQQSGSFYNGWSWFLTEKMNADLHAAIRRETDCCGDLTSSIFSCMGEMSSVEVQKLQAAATKDLQGTFWVPVADNDFFAASITEEDYDFPNDVDLMIGYNGQEGGLSLAIDLYAASFYYGYFPTSVPLSHASGSTETLCSTVNPESVENCKTILIEQYGLDDAANDVERAIRLSYMYGEMSFNIDCTRELRAHSSSSKSTYAYYFTELYDAPEAVKGWAVPNGLKVSADHADEIPFVFGVPYALQNVSALIEAYYGEAEAEDVATQYYVTSESDQPLSGLMMTAWTNFAKSGNPNQPETLPGGIPSWPAFTLNDGQFMELKSNGSEVIATPEEDRIDTIISEIFSDRTDQISRQAAPEDPENPCLLNGAENLMFQWCITITSLLLLIKAQ